MNPCVNLIGGPIPPWDPREVGMWEVGGAGGPGNEMLGLWQKEGRGLMFNMERSSGAQRPWRECVRLGVDGKKPQSH